MHLEISNAASPISLRRIVSRLRHRIHTDVWTWLQKARKCAWSVFFFLLYTPPLTPKFTNRSSFIRCAVHFQAGTENLVKIKRLVWLIPTKTSEVGKTCPPPPSRAWVNISPMVPALRERALASSYASLPVTGPRAHFFFVATPLSARLRFRLS